MSISATYHAKCDSCAGLYPLTGQTKAGLIAALAEDGWSVGSALTCGTCAEAFREGE